MPCFGPATEEWHSEGMGIEEAIEDLTADNPFWQCAKEVDIETHIYNVDPSVAF